MPLMLDWVSTKLLAVGMSGCGKTLFTNDYICRSNYDYYFVFDHDGQFAQRNRIAPALNPAQLLAQLKRGFVVFNPSEMFDDVTVAFEWFNGYAYNLSEKLYGKTKVLYCDEVQDIVPLNKIGRYTKKVQMSGRNRGLDFIGCSLQYNFVHNTIRGQASITVAFCTQEPLALNALVARGFNPDEVAALPRGSYILRNKNTGEERRGKIF